MSTRLAGGERVRGRKELCCWEYHQIAEQIA